MSQADGGQRPRLVPVLTADPPGLDLHRATQWPARDPRPRDHSKAPGPPVAFTDPALQSRPLHSKDGDETSLGKASSQETPGQESRLRDAQPEPCSAPGTRRLWRGGTERLRLWVAEWRPRLIPCPHPQGQLEYVTSHAQGGPGTLAWDWDRGSSARFLAWALHTLPAFPGRSQRTEESATRPVTCTESGLQGTRQGHQVTSVSSRADRLGGSQGPPQHPKSLRGFLT